MIIDIKGTGPPVPDGETNHNATSGMDGLQMTEQNARRTALGTQDLRTCVGTMGTLLH